MQGLWAAVSGPATTSAPAPDPLYVLSCLTGVIAMGLVVLTAWIIRRAANPQKFRLLNSPGRKNTVNPGHIVLLLAMFLGATTAGHFFFQRFYPLNSGELLISEGLCGQTFWLLACLAVGAMCFRHGLVRGMGWSLRHFYYDTARGVLGYLGAMPIVIALLLVTSLILPADWQKEHEVLQALRTLSPAWKTLAVLSAAVLAPLAEESFFRGLLQSMIRRYSGSPWAAIWVASAVFAASHFLTPQNIPAIFALGVVLGYNYERCGRMYPSVLIHSIFNLVFILIQLKQG
jgi:membrane protease YdiL (CAAX protease family)